MQQFCWTYHDIGTNVPWSATLLLAFSVSVINLKHSNKRKPKDLENTQTNQLIDAIFPMFVLPWPSSGNSHPILNDSVLQ